MKWIVLILLWICSFSFVSCSWPTDFVNSSIELIVPFPKIGSTYPVALLLNSTFAQIFGISFNIIAENNSYATWANISTSPADGSSITIVDSPNIFWGGIAPPPSYNLNNIVFLSFFINSPIILVVNDSDNQPNTFQEFVTQTKAKGFANIGGTPGFGNFIELELRQQTGLNLIFFPFNIAPEIQIALQNGTIDMSIATTLINGSNTSQSRTLAISSQVFSGPYVDVPTFGQLGLELDSFGVVYGIAVSPQMSESLRQEISLAFSNVSNDPNFNSQVELGGNSVLIGYNYESSTLNNFINHMINSINQALGINQPSTQSPTKLNSLPIILGVIIPIFVILLLITIIFTIYLKKKNRKSKLKVFDSISLTAYEIGKRNTLESMTITWNEIIDLEEIGSGSFGQVYKGKYRGAQVAIKALKSTDLTAKQIEDFLNELELMVNLKPHPNVIKLIGICKEPYFVIILEYMENGSLEKLICNKNLEFTADLLIGIAKDVASGIYHLHSEKIIHRDIACRNILLDDRYIAKIADFGLARITHEQDKGYTESTIGPVRHMAPECLTRREYSIQSDVWAYGITLCEMFIRGKPYAEYSLLQIASLVSQGKLKPIPDHNWPTVVRNLIEDCCRFNPTERIQSFEEIFKRLEGVQIIPSSSLLHIVRSQSSIQSSFQSTKQSLETTNN